jgi:hypothetical protein
VIALVQQDAFVTDGDILVVVEAAPEAAEVVGHEENVGKGSYVPLQLREVEHSGQAYHQGSCRGGGFYMV